MPNNFPHDIAIIILTKLAVKSLLRFKCVCKLWRSLIKDPQFIKQHHDTCKSNLNCQKLLVTGGECHQKDEYLYSTDIHDSIASLLQPPIHKKVKINHLSCVYFINGILVLIFHYEIVVLWNPATRELKRIIYPILEVSYFDAVIYGFGYDSSIDDYKIIGVGKEVPSRYHEVYICSTKSRSWKLMGKFHPDNEFFDGDIVTVDGIVYIIAMTDLSNTEPHDFTILRFCLDKDQLEEILFPDRIERWADPVLCALGQSLCLTRLHNDSRRDLEVWYMTKNGMSNSWSKMLTIPSVHCGRCLRPVSFMKNGDILLLEFNGEFVVYNSKRHQVKQVKVAGLEASLYFNWVVPYFETLFSPNS